MDTTMHTPGGPSQGTTTPVVNPNAHSTPSPAPKAEDDTNSVVMHSAGSQFSTPKQTAQSWLRGMSGRSGGRSANLATPISSRFSSRGSSSSGSGSSRRFFARQNPFDNPCVDRLQQSIVSPSLFNHVQSPSVEEVSVKVVIIWACIASPIHERRRNMMIDEGLTPVVASTHAPNIVTLVNDLVDPDSIVHLQ